MKKHECGCLDSCKYCPHERIQHFGNDGPCQVGMSINQPCGCLGFCEKEIVEIGV
jgi:hypothetical protein